MREIKFRAWDKYLKRYWYEWDPAVIQAVVFHNNRYVPEQFTGLRDQRDKEIYEGDILVYAPYCNYGHSESYESDVVLWGSTGDSDGWAHGKHYEWVVGVDSLADVADSVSPDQAYCRVVGNVHETPELLEGNELE